MIPELKDFWLQQLWNTLKLSVLNTCLFPIYSRTPSRCILKLLILPITFSISTCVLYLTVFNCVFIFINYFNYYYYFFREGECTHV